MIRCYAAALPELQAADQLAAIEAASVPHMKDPAPVIRQHLRRANGEPSATHASSAVEALAQAGIPTVHVPKEVSDQ